MRTSTILGISLSLATGVIVGWFISSLSTATPSPTPPAQLVADNVQIAALNPPHYPNIHQRDPDLERAERLLSASRTAEALTVLSEVSPNIDLSSANGKEWLRLLVDASANTDNIDQLLLIYDRYPTALGSNEHAALAVADALIAKQQTADYRPLRKLWLAKETQKARWLFLDVQEKINDGKPAEAIVLLESTHLNGKDETDRLVRLAALHVINDPKRAWSYLSEAAQKDPSNADIRTFKASVGEMLNQNQTAQSDYLVAVQNDPESPFRREQLADYYIRTGQYPHALKVLQDTMLDPSLDSIWLKTLFWSRVSVPVKNTWQGAEIPEGSLKELVMYIDKLPEGIFWNANAFEELPNGQHYLATRQETANR